MYTIFSLIFFSIFTSVVVYSRTTIKQKSKYNNSVSNNAINCIGFLLNVEAPLLFAQLCNAKKKCGAHTHAHHLFATSSLNIHVGCCLFSHNFRKQKREQLKDSVELVFMETAFSFH